MMRLSHSHDLHHALDAFLIAFTTNLQKQKQWIPLSKKLTNSPFSEIYTENFNILLFEYEFLTIKVFMIKVSRLQELYYAPGQSRLTRFRHMT